MVPPAEESGVVSLGYTPELWQVLDLVPSAPEPADLLVFL